MKQSKGQLVRLFAGSIVALLFVLSGFVGITKAHASRSLYHAVEKGDVEEVDRCLAWGADPNFCQSEEAPIGLWQLIQSMFPRSPTLELKEAPLLLALDDRAGGDESDGARLSIARSLVHAGVDPNTHDGRGMYALMFAASWDRGPVITTLVQAGARVNHANGPYTALMLACIYDNYQGAATLLRSGANPDFTGREHRTALMMAIHGQHEAIARLLIYYKARIDIVDNYGTTAVEIARDKLGEIVPLLESERKAVLEGNYSIRK